MQRLSRRSGSVLITALMLALSVGVGVGVGVASASAAPDARMRAADGGSTCTGSLEHPGILSGEYSGNVTIEGVCATTEGPATVDGTLTVLPEGALDAAYSGEPVLTVTGSLNVERGAAAVLGCEPNGIECFNNTKATGTVHLDGNLEAKDAVGIVMHKGTVRGNVKQTGGGGGLNCENPGPGIYRTIGFPVYTDYEDSLIEGNIKLTGLKSCFLGMFRTEILGSMTLNKDLLANPEEINLAIDTVSHNLSCSNDSKFFFDSDTILGKSKGECSQAGG